MIWVVIDSNVYISALLFGGNPRLVLECALEAHATVIVAGDVHLLKLHPYSGIAILTPKRFLESRPWETA